MEKKTRGAVEFGRRVAKARKEAGMTQAELTRRLVEFGLHMPATAIAKIETGTRPTVVPELLAIAVVLDVSPNELVGATEADRGERMYRELGRQLDALGVAHLELMAAAARYRQVNEVVSEVTGRYFKSIENDPEALERFQERLERFAAFYPADPIEAILNEPQRAV